MPGIDQNSPEIRALSPKQEAAALHLAAGRSRRDAAKRTRISVASIKNWVATQPAFSRRITELRSEMTAQALGRLTDGAVSAAETLGYLARKSRSEQVRLMAARAVLEMSTRLRETVEFEERLKRLEEQREPQRAPAAA